MMTLEVMVEDLVARSNGKIPFDELKRILITRRFCESLPGDKRLKNIYRSAIASWYEDPDDMKLEAMRRNRGNIIDAPGEE